MIEVMNPMPTQPKALRIIRAHEPITVEHPIFLIVGQPGICKSSLGFSAKDPITLNFDGENGLARAVNRRDALDISTVDQFRELRTDHAIITPFSTITVDTAGRALDLLTLDVIDETPKHGKNGNLTQQGWGDLKTKFRSWMNQLRALRKDILLIAHSKEDSDGDTKFYRPDIPGGSLAEVLKIADFVGYLYMSGKTRVLDFNPTEKWYGKNPANWRPFNIPAPEHATDFMARLFDEGRAALGKISEASAGVVRQVDEFKADISTYTAAAEFNRAIPKIKALPKHIQIQIAPALMKRAEQLGITLNEDTKTFVDPVRPNGQPAPASRLFA